jgi:uncharacterized protein (TIGR02646 family)
LRHIKSGAEPQLLTQRRAQLQATQDVGNRYEQLGGDVHNAVIAQRIREQGGLCAYTNIRIDAGNAHIEHMYPKSHCDPAETIAYWNMVACSPGPTAADPPFGAKHKADWPNREQRPDFLLPTDRTCEMRIVYRCGYPHNSCLAEGADTAAAETIERLGLNNHPLPYWRAQSLQPLRNLRNLSEVKAVMKLLADRTGRGEEYCVAKWQYLANRLRKLEAKRQAIGPRPGR